LIELRKYEFEALTRIVGVLETRGLHVRADNGFFWIFFDEFFSELFKMVET
jgi:hypothetical protein